MYNSDKYMFAYDMILKQFSQTSLIADAQVCTIKRNP